MCHYRYQYNHDRYRPDESPPTSENYGYYPHDSISPLKMMSLRHLYNYKIQKEIISIHWQAT